MGTVFHKHKKHLITLSLVAGSFFLLDKHAVSVPAVVEVVNTPSYEEVFRFEQKTFGYSAQGKPIEGYEIGTGKDVIFMFSSIHGNEMGTTDLLNKLVAEIRAHPEIISREKKLIVMPIANPDGYYDRIDKLNANEVNLNLNFPTKGWEEYGQDGQYAGPEPFSEVESRVIKDVVEQYKPELMIAFHARGALVSPEKQESSKQWSKWYAEKSGYDYFTEWDYFGTATRWFEETTGKPAITVELTDYLKDDWKINKPVLIELISSDALPVGE